MKDKIIYRNFQKGDYEEACKWWDWWWKGEAPIERELLPPDEHCFLVEKNNIPIVAGFLYAHAKAPVGYFTYMVSNPDYREKDRRNIIESLIQYVEDESKKQGIKFLFTVCGSTHMENIHTKLGWTVDKTAPAYETFKYI